MGSSAPSGRHRRPMPTGKPSLSSAPYPIRPSNISSATSCTSSPAKTHPPQPPPQATLTPGQHAGLSPIASICSSTSCLPKSSSSTGPIHSPIDYEIQQAPQNKSSINSLADIDERLENINESVFITFLFEVTLITCAHLKNSRWSHFFSGECKLLKMIYAQPSMPF